MNATSLSPPQALSPGSAYSPASASDVDGFESFAAWDDAPISSFGRSPGKTNFHVLPPQRAISSISQPRLDDASSGFRASGISSETSFASLTQVSITVETTIHDADDNWPFSKFSPPKQRPSIVRRRRDSSSARSEDVPLLSTAWSDLSSSSMSTSLTCSTSTLMSSSFADSQTFDNNNNNSSYFVESDGTVVAVAYPIPDPLLTATPTTSSTMPQGLPQGTAHLQPDLILPPPSGSRKSATVEFAPGSQNEFYVPMNILESGPNACIPVELQENQVNRSNSSAPVSLFRPDSFNRKNENETMDDTRCIVSNHIRKSKAPPRSPTPPQIASQRSVYQQSMDEDDTILRRKSVRFAEPLCQSFGDIPSVAADEEVSLRGEQHEEQCGYVTPRIPLVQFHLHASSGSWEDDSYEPDYLEPPTQSLESSGSRSEPTSENTSPRESSEGTVSQKSLDFSTFMKLQQDAAYRHAVSAGYLWQSLVGQHVNFPSSWWNGARGPGMGMEEPSSHWMYIARHRVHANSFLNQLVPRRMSPGQLLLHIIVQDLITWKPVQDIVLGCFHSNARGVRRTDHAIPENEKCREVWMAVRKRCDDVSVVDCLLTEGEKLENCARQSPLMGSRDQVTNVNLKAVFGEEPPRRTLFLLESDLYSRLIEAAELSPKQPPALLLLAQSFSNPVAI